MALYDENCVDQKGENPLGAEEIPAYLEQIENGWRVDHNQEIEKTYTFKNFTTGWNFSEKVKELALQQKHHPEIGVADNTIRILLRTDDVNGLTRNDFIMAAKIDKIAKEEEKTTTD